MRRNSSHHQNSSIRKITLSQLPPLSSSTLTSGYACYKGIARRRGSDPSQEVRCLTQDKEQIMVYLPPYLPHNMAVRAVEDILDKHHYKLDKHHSTFPYSEKLSFSSFYSPHPSTRSSLVADLHRKANHEEDQTIINTAGESSCTGESQFDSGMFSEPRQSLMLNKRSNSQDISTDKMYSSSVLKRLDSLEKKISAFSIKTENDDEVADIPDEKMNSEDREIKQLLFRKLTKFRNNMTVNYK